MKRFCALLLVALPACLLHAQSTPAPAAAPHAPAPPTRERLAQCLERMAGLGPAPAIEQVESFSLAKEFPFLGEQAGDDHGWRVRLAMTKLPWPANLRGRPDAYPRRVTVFLDAGAERILAVTARAVDPSADPALAAMPAPPTADRELLLEPSFFGPFSQVHPKLTWMDALAQVCGRGAGYPPIARDIDAYYLQHGASGETQRSVWFVDLHGLPASRAMSHLPVLTLADPTPYDRKPRFPQFERARTIVDAATGHILDPMNEGPDDRFPDLEDRVTLSLDSLHPKIHLR